jgi:hypothetical protein
MTMPRLLRLYGNGSTEIGVVQAATLTQVAAALSLGGAPKRYGNAVTNEDAILLCEHGSKAFIALADAHNGPEAGHITLDWLAEQCADRWATDGIAPSDWPSVAIEAISTVNKLICRSNRLCGSSSRTTLAMALVDFAHSMVLVAGVGDSHVFAVTTVSARPVAVSPSAGTFFLGTSDSSDDLVSHCAIEVIDQADVAAIVLASDGISTPGIGFADPAAEVLAISRTAHETGSGQLAPLALAEAIAESACRTQHVKQSGDNISVAVTSRASQSQGRDAARVLLRRDSCAASPRRSAADSQRCRSSAVAEIYVRGHPYPLPR